MKIQIAIRGRKYTVKSDDSGVNLARIAEYVDARMADVAARATGADEYTVAMMAALNIASDFERYRQQVDEEMAAIDRELASTMVLLDAALPTDAPEDGEDLVDDEE
jgi:cell division protein ZapA (FtsZ GTPase activity inhibitor)